MVKPKNLNINKINELFDKYFEVDKNELTKGITCWTLTPKKEKKDIDNENSIKK